ncbi:unnamed protein product, partial [marine sediment metagenome]
MQDVEEKPQLQVNGKNTNYKLNKGYIRLNRKWKAGDRVELILPMPVTKVRAHEKVEDDQDRFKGEFRP